MSSSTLSPQQAADRVGTSRWTVSRALLSGDLEGNRNNRGHWRVEANAVDAWAELHVRTDVPAEQPTEQSDSAAHMLAIENSALKAERDQLRERLTEAQADKEKLIELLAQPRWPWSLLRRQKDGRSS